MSFSRDEVQELIQTSVENGLLAALTRIGVDTSQPLEVQKDMAWLRQTRLRCDDAKNKITGSLVLGGLGLILTLIGAGALEKLRGFFQ